MLFAACFQIHFTPLLCLCLSLSLYLYSLSLCHSVVVKFNTALNTVNICCTKCVSDTLGNKGTMSCRNSMLNTHSRCLNASNGRLKWHSRCSIFLCVCTFTYRHPAIDSPFFINPMNVCRKKGTNE